MIVSVSVAALASGFLLEHEQAIQYGCTRLYSVSFMRRFGTSPQRSPRLTSAVTAVEFCACNGAIATLTSSTAVVKTTRCSAGESAISSIPSHYLASTASLPVKRAKTSRERRLLQRNQTCRHPEPAPAHHHVTLPNSHMTQQQTWRNCSSC